MDIREKAKEIRKLILKMANRSKSAHVGSSLSCADILAALYFDTMRYPSAVSEDRDMFILSKGHAAMALYATLAAKGVVEMEKLDGYLLDNGTLPAHLDKFVCDGVETSTGALGHGFNIAIGVAHAYKLNNKANRVFTLMGDGEVEEGSVWEGAMLAPKLSLNNLTAIIDRNNLQGFGRPSELLSYEPLKEKWQAFGWDVHEIDGHNVGEIKEALAIKSDKPKVIIAKTIKGKGVSFMEDRLEWHYYIVTDEHLQTAMKELDNA